MPTVLRLAGFAFMINTEDHDPPHVHVWKAGQKARIDLAPVRVSQRATMSIRDLARAAAIVSQHRAFLLEKWGEYHGQT